MPLSPPSSESALDLCREAEIMSAGLRELQASSWSKGRATLILDVDLFAAHVRTLFRAWRVANETTGYASDTLGEALTLLEVLLRERYRDLQSRSYTCTDLDAS